MGLMANKAEKNKKTTTVIGEHTILQGNLITKNHVWVEGKVEGSIFAEESVYISEGSVVDGGIKAKEVKIFGEVNGDVEVENLTKLEPGARLRGSVETCGLSIAEGAVFNGKCKMKKDSTSTSHQDNKEEKTPKDKVQPFGQKAAQA